VVAKFDDRAPDWDTPEKIERGKRVAAAVAAGARITASDRVFDLGAGTGLVGFALAELAGDVTLADASAGMLAQAKAKIDATGIGNVKLLHHQFTVDPLPAERFDVVTGMVSLHHVPDTAKALAEIFCLLAPGGRLAIADLDTEDGTYHSDQAEEVIHGFDRASLGALALAAGFQDPTFSTILEIRKRDRTYPVFLLVARRP
jgi:ubiquinone/menaquinone biosynthesis C-methylase UbiE